MRISDWSSDVCSSDLGCADREGGAQGLEVRCLAGDRVMLPRRYKPPAPVDPEKAWDDYARLCREQAATPETYDHLTKQGDTIRASRLLNEYFHAAASHLTAKTNSHKYAAHHPILKY